MIYLVPNIFLEETSHQILSTDTLFSIIYRTNRAKKLIVRNTMHSLIILQEGQKRLTLTNKTLQIDSSKLLFLAQGSYIMSEVLSPNGKYKAFLIYFHDRFVLEFLKKYSIDPSPTVQKKVAVLHKDFYLQNLLNTIPHLQHIPHSSQLLQLKIEELFLYLYKTQKKEFCKLLYYITSSSDERVKYLLEENIDLIESVEDMTKVARISQYALRKQIKKLYNLSPKQWLIQQKLKKAAFLLKNSEKSISQIATECGFASPSWFGYLFKKEFGSTPKEYRKNRENSSKTV